MGSEHGPSRRSRRDRMTARSSVPPTTLSRQLPVRRTQNTQRAGEDAIVADRRASHSMGADGLSEAVRRRSFAENDASIGFTHDGTGPCRRKSTPTTGAPTMFATFTDPTDAPADLVCRRSASTRCVNGSSSSRSALTVVITADVFRRRPARACSNDASSCSTARWAR